MMSNLGHWKYPTVFVLALLLLSSCCAKETTIVLLPDPDGKVGHITVSNDAGSVDITRASEATIVSGKGSSPSHPTILPDEKIAADFSHVLSMLPIQPQHFILYFNRGSTDLTADSEKTLPKIFESIADRNSQDISVIGHTDTAGNRQYNLRLSTNRAQAVSRLLIDKGIAPMNIKSTSHGEENPLIKTADNVHEKRNRRVEVVVR